MYLRSVEEKLRESFMKDITNNTTFFFLYKLQMISYFQKLKS